MARPVHVVVLFLVVSFSASAQSVLFNASVGAGAYAMDDIKAFQTDVKNQMPFNPTVTDAFPPYLFYEASCQMAARRFFSGLSVAYGSTGGRVLYRDYSGYLRADQNLKYINLSMPIGLRIDVREKLSLSVDLNPTYTFSTVDLKFEQEIQGEYDKEELNVKSQTIAIQPGVMIMRRIGRFGIQGKISYYMTLVKGKLYVGDSQDVHLVNDNGKPVYAGWDGLRLSLGAAFFIRREYKQ